MTLSFPKHLGCLLAGLTAACVSPPERDPVQTAGDKAPSQWSVPAGAVGEVRPWLRTFESSELDSLVQTALSGNYELRALAARIDQAQALARIEGARRKPQLAFAPGFQHVGVPTADEVAGTAWEVGFGVSWELDVWGRIRSLQEAAEAEAEAVRADVAGAVLSLSARTVQTCFDLAEARQQVRVEEQWVAERRTLVGLVQGRFNQGLTAGLDLSMAKTDLSGAEAQLQEARNRVQLTARRLETLLGHYPAGAIEYCTDLPELPRSAIAGVPSELLARRPDIGAGFARLRAQDGRLASARKALLPRLTLTAAGGARGSNQPELFDPRSLGWNLAMGLVQPIYLGGRLRAEIDLNAALVEESLQHYRNIVLTAFREVEQSLAAEEWLLNRQKSLAETVRRTDITRKLAIRSYRNGLVDMLTVLDSYRSTLSANSDLLAAKRDVLNNRVNLYLALGGEV
jgi:NodT family efflux transporter outer membrane factor (OMF) lipoprotein